MHDEYWKAVWDRAHERLNGLFEGCSHGLADIVGDGNGIDSYHDAKMVLAHAMRCADSAEERSCAVLSVVEALQALHELHEHAVAPVKQLPVAGVMVK